MTGRDVTPIPKPRKRVRTREGVEQCRQKCKREAVCRRCGRRPSGHPLDALNAAHLVGGSHREWIPAAVIPLDGSGTTGCHHAFDNDIDVRREMWPKLTPDEQAYVIDTVGKGGTERRFGVNL